MITKKQIKQHGKLVFEGYSYTDGVDEVFTKIVLQVGRDGFAEITTTAVHSNSCDLNLEHIMAEMADLGGVGLEFLMVDEDRERIAEWLEQVEKTRDTAA